MFEKIIEWVKAMDFWVIYNHKCLHVRFYSISPYKTHPFSCNELHAETGNPTNDYHDIDVNNIFLTKEDAVAKLARREENRHQRRVRELKDEIKRKPESEESNANSSK